MRRRVSKHLERSTKISCLDDFCIVYKGSVMFTPRCIVLLSAYVYIAGGQQRGDLRFRGSFSDETSGRLEVFSNNQWGTMCTDGFTKLSADTACRQLGSVEALTFGEAERLGYGQGSGQIHITELECSTDDIHILRCVIHNNLLCTHSSDVAVVCSTQPAFQFDGGIRLIGGPHRSEGMLELYFFGQWGGVCGGRTFDRVTADAACIALGYTRSRSVPRLVSRLQNTSSPVWVIASSINCFRVDSCFDTCYRDPVNRNDLSSACGNNFIYLNCEFDNVINSRCLASPFDPTPNGGGFGVSGSVSQETDSTALAITLPLIFGICLIILIVTWCTACGGYKMVKSCFKGCYECCCGSLECCFDGCLSILRFFDIRRCFEDRDSGNTAVYTGRTSPNLQPRTTINEELEALEMEAMNQSSRAQRTSSSSSIDSDHSHKKESNELPDYRHALKYVATEGGDAKPSSDDQKPPPSYDSVA